MKRMDNNFGLLINDVLESIDNDPLNELTEVKVKTLLDAIYEVNDLPPHIFFIVTFLLAITSYQKSEEIDLLYKKVASKITMFLVNYDYFPLSSQGIKEYFDSNLANAILPLNEYEANVHKTGDIIHFTEHKYTDATGRKFISISTPNYDKQQSLLQFRLSEQLKSE